MPLDNMAWADHRASARDEVHYRARAVGPDARQMWLLIVNISAQGLMARYDGDMPVGTQLRITLPVVGTVLAEVRWSLGGRIGCALEAVVPLSHYYALLTALGGR